MIDSILGFFGSVFKAIAGLATSDAGLDLIGFNLGMDYAKHNDPARVKAICDLILNGGPRIDASLEFQKLIVRLTRDMDERSRRNIERLAGRLNLKADLSGFSVPVNIEEIRIFAKAFKDGLT